jgi:hypothetical protein
MRGNKLHVDQTKRDKERGAGYARGGKGAPNKMLPEQAANPQRPGRTGHVVEGSAPGVKAARGGGRTPANIGGVARPAKAGATGPG